MSLSEQKLSELEEELDAEVDERCQKLRALGKTLVLSLRRELVLFLTKLPKKIKSMQYSEFEMKYGGSSKRVLDGDVEKCAEEGKKYVEQLRTPRTARRPPLPNKTTTQQTSRKRPRGLPTGPPTRRVTRSMSIRQDEDGTSVLKTPRIHPLLPQTPQVSFDNRSDSLLVDIEGVGAIDIANKDMIAQMSETERQETVGKLQMFQSQISDFMSQVAAMKK